MAMLFYTIHPEYTPDNFAGCEKMNNETLNNIGLDRLNHTLEPKDCKDVCVYGRKDDDVNGMKIRNDYCKCLWRYTEEVYGTFSDTNYPRVHVIMLMVLMGLFILSTIEGLLEVCQCVTNAPYKLLYKNRTDEWGNVQNFISK